MSQHQQPIDPITAEHLIRRARTGSIVDPEPLAGLLAAAAAPGRPVELTGEEAAVMAFSDARLALTPQPRRPMRKSTMAKLATAQAVIVLAVAGAGVALAGGLGHLPGAASSNEHATARPAASAASRAPASGSATANSAHNAAASHHPAPSGSPSPNLRGLCTAYQAAVGDNPGKALDNPAFTVLISTAGGKDKVAAYCTTLLATPASTAPTHPGQAPTHPSPPTGPPSTHPSHPTNTPSTPNHPSPPATPTP
jgi:hypothetical protein